MNDNLKNLYNTLLNNGYAPPSFEQFEKDMQDEKNLRGVYSTLQKEGFTPPSFDQFKKDMGYVVPQPQQPVQQPVSKPTQQPVQQQVRAGGGVFGGMQKRVDHAVESLKNIAAIAPSPATSADEATPQTRQPKQEEQPQKQGGWQPTWQEKMGMQMQLDDMTQRMEQSRKEQAKRMENMQKGTSIGRQSERIFNPETGKFEQKFYTTTGEEVDSWAEQSRINMAERDRWERDTEEGQASHKKRIEEARRRQAEAHRRQVEDLSSDIDAALSDAKGRSVKQYTDYATENPFMAAMLSTAGAASPSDMQRQAYEQVHRSEHIPAKEAEQLHKEIVDLEAAQRSMRDAKRIIGEADHNAQKGTFGKWLERSFAGGVVRGFGQKLFDVDTWDFGGSDLSDAGALMTALNAYDRGEELTRSQQMLLDAKAVELATDAYFGSEVGRGYKAGKVTAESIPFMLEMCINPAAGTGHTASSMMTRYALKRFGKQAVKNNVKKYVAAKVGARVAGDVVGAATMAATTGAGRTAADAIERMNGQVMFDTDAQGQSVFAGHTEGDDVATAIGKAFANTTIENYSEMVGEYFAPVLGTVGKAVRKGMGKIGLESVGRFVDDVAASDVAKMVSDFEKHSKWNGMIGEYAEEVAGGIMNALVVGDQTLDTDPETGVFNLDNNIDTFLGVSLLGGFMSGVKAAGYRTPKYRARQQMKQADETALHEFGGNQDAWGAIRNTLAFGNVEDVKSMLAEVLTSAEYSDEQKMSVFEYSEAVERYKGMLRGEKKSNPDTPGSFEPTGDVSRFGDVYHQETGGMADAVNHLFAQRSGMVRNVLHDERLGDIGMVWGDDRAGLYHMIMRHVVEQSDYESVNELASAIDATLKNGELEVHGDNYVFMHEGNRAVVVKDTEGNYVLTSYDTTRSKEGKRRSEADATRLYHDIFDREDGNLVPPSLTSDSKGNENISSDQEDAEKIADIEKDVMQKARQYGYEASVQERRDIAIELTDPNNTEAQEAWNGVVERINADAAYMVAQQRELSKKMQHTDGGFHAATLKEKDDEGNDKEVYIVDGTVNMMPDGTMVDPTTSDKSVVIFDPATGERRMIDPTADTGISHVGETTTAADHEAEIERGRQEYVQSQIDEAQGTVRLAPGQQLILPTGEEAVVVATDADGENITVALGDGTQATVQRSELQRIRDEKAMAEYRQRHGSLTPDPSPKGEGSEMPQAGAGGVVAGAPADYTADMELTIRDEDGSEKPAMVMGRVRYENGSFVPDANGNIIEYFMDGEVKHDHEDKLVDKVVSHVAPQQPEAETTPTTTEPQAPQTDEERVIREGIAGIGEGLRDAVNEQAAGVRENDINNWLRKPSVADAMRKYGEGAQSVEEVVQRALADNPNEETKAALGDIMRFDSSKQLVQGYISQPQPAQPAEAPTQPTEQPTAEPMPVGEDGEEDWQATTPERAHAYIFNEAGLSRSEGNEFIAAQTRAAQNALVKAKSAQMPRVGTSIKKYNEAKAKRQEKIDEAQRVLDYWNGVREIQNAIQREENERRAAEDAVRHDEAVAEAQADYEARKQAEAERKAVGNENPMPAITEKWNNATKVDGHRDEIMLPDGTPLKGHYVLHESGASSPSHNPETWQKTDGFPMDANDNSVNDRDYERDHDAQEHTQSIARQYDYWQEVQTIGAEAAQAPGKIVDDAAEAMPTVKDADGGERYYDSEDLFNEIENERRRQEGTGPVEGTGAAEGVGPSSDAEGVERPADGGGATGGGESHYDGQVTSETVVDRQGLATTTFSQYRKSRSGRIGKVMHGGIEAQADDFILDAEDGVFDDFLGNIDKPIRVKEIRRTKEGKSFADIRVDGVDYDGVPMKPEAAQRLIEASEQLKPAGLRDKLKPDSKKLGENVAKAKALTEQEATEVLQRMEEAAVEDPQISLTPESWANTFGLNNSLETPIGNVKMGGGQYKKFFDKNRSAEFGMAVQTLQDPDIIFIEPSQAKEGQVTERPYSYVFVKSFIRNGEKMKYYASVTVQRDNMEVSVSSHIMKPTKVKERLTTLERIYTKQALISNSSDGHLAEQPKAVPDLLPTQENNAFSAGKGSENSSSVQEKGGKNAESQSPIQGLDGYTEDEVLSLVRGNIEEKLADAGIDGVTIKGMALHGSRLRGDAREDSDLDVVVEYEGDMSEDGLFNILNDEPMVIEGVRVDVNPITRGKSGTLDQYMERSRQYDALRKAERETNTEPTEAQKEAGNYKKGHVKIDGYDVTIENPKGSVRSGVNGQTGQRWATTMQNTYGYIRGTEGVDGDHIDVFFSEDPSQGDVFVVDQVNKDGSFDEHKVMYGFPDIESARKAYLSNYKDGWQGLGAITPVSKEEFKKWINSSHRKTKPFAEYSSVKPLGDTQLGEQPNKPTVKAGEDYVSAAERIAGENEVKRTAAHFAEETQEEAAAFDKRVPKMDDAELLAYMQEDGRGDLNKAHHPSVYDEYDYRHGDEQLQSYDDTLVRLNESGTTLEQAEEMLANIQKDVSRLATEDRAMLLGQEEALQEYIAGKENEVPGHDLQEHIDTLAALQDNGKGYDENAYDAYAAGRRFGNGVNGRLSKREAFALAHKMVDENHARGGVYVLPFLDGVGDSMDLRLGRNKDEVSKREKEYRAKKSGLPNEAEASTLGSSAKISSADSESPVATNKSLAGSATDISAGKVTDLFVNEQGNPVDADGNLILEEISSVDELKGEDFSNPTRNVQLPKIPERVDKAIGAGGKPLIIKKNIFEKNARDHRDLKPSQSREILKTALYTPDLYGQNQQVSRPYNYVVISTKGADGKNKLVLLEVNNGKENVEIVHWHYIRDKALETLKRQAEREGGHILILPSDNSKEAGGLSSRTLDLSSIGKGTDLFGNAQGNGKKSSSDGKIDDVGEVLAGARKDMRREIAKSLANVTEAALVEKPFGKVYKKPDLKKAVESGALREKDAIFYDALFSQVNQQKPKETQSEKRSKRYIPDFKTKAERWAADTFKQMEVLRQFMELDEPGRDAMMERMLADRYPTREQELAEIEKRKGWNPDYEGHKYEWGEMTTPNPLWVTHEVMNRLGYSVGDKLDVPYGVVKANTSGTGYSIEDLKGERASLFGSGMTLDEAIDTAVYLARLKRGDADVSHPTQLFAFPATKSEYGESGRYRVMWGRDYKTREFDSKEEADAFAQTKKGAFVSPINEVKRRFGYKVQFYHPLTGERIFVDDAEFDTKADAQAYFDGNFEKINDATNARLQAEREKKGERKTLKADDVVHVTMVHSSQGGWTHAVVIDKKYANNDGMVRIIKEGFASRKDAEAFAGSIKDEVLKTVLKHKEEAKKIVYFDTGENSRIGEDYRNGKNVDAEDFMNTFGFRGVQFGNWTNQADRQMAVNQAYDAFMDMARLIGVTPKAMSLNGELGIAFGARGVGGFAAHYEPGEVVINLTKTQGAGSLAHEWWHALDNYFARRAGSTGDMVTDNRRIEMRDALRKAFNDMLDLVNGSDYAQRSAAKGEYWGRTHEITARLLAEWVDRELKKRGELNTFLSRGAVVERGQQHNYNVYEVLERLAGREPMPFEEYKELPESLKGIPYPSAKEVEQFGASLRHIFDTLEERVDEETGNVMLYEPTATYETRDGGKVVCRSLFDEMGVRSRDEVAMVSQHTQQGQGQNQVIAPSEIRLRKLKKGETCHVERVYEETKQFDFTGKEKVESAEDVAYIFRQLENAAVENSFLVLVKDGKPTVIHLGVGSYVNVMAPYEQALVAYRELKPEQVYFVHNHPSGVLKASRQDQELLKRVKMAFGEDVVQQGIIIDTTSGKYGEFDMVADNYDLVQTSGVEAMPQSEGADVPVKVYQFSRQVFAPDWNPESAFKIVSSQSVAEFVSSHRLGEHKKMSFLVLNNNGNVVANVFLPWTKLSDIKRSKDAGDLLAGYVHQCGGVRGVLYGNYDYEADDRAVLAAVGGRMRQLYAPLMDALHVEHSAYENGWAGVGEPKEGYGVEATPFHNIIDEMFGNEDFDKSAHARERYDLGATPEWMKGVGISGERFTLSFKNIKTHLGKDADHNLTAKEWHELPSALKHPFLVTSYGNKDGKFRLYTTIKVGDKFAVVGVDVVRINQGKGVPMLELNRIKTVFGRDRYVVENGERILAWDKNITPEQEALLRGHNYREYPTIQELSAAKVGNNSDIAKENGENVVEDTAKVKRTMQEDRDMMRSAVRQMGEKLHTNINIIEDVNEITHPNAAVQERRRRSKGWYDTATGQVNIVLDNNKNIDDVKASVGHETIAHKGLRELVGEENYDEFLDETYQHLRDDLKKGVDDAAGKMFLAAMTSQHTGRTYERCRREAVDELFGRMAEKPFEEFSEGERTLWQRIKATVRRLLDKFLGSLKLPKWFELGDNELRYILWRSKERLERGKEHPIDLARDIVKREELGLTDEARYNMGDVAEPSFAARRDRAVKEHGYVHPGLNSAEVKVVSIKERTPFDTSKKTKALKEDVVAYANEHGIIGTMTEEETKGKGKVTISNASIEKMVDDSATDKSVDKDTHLSVIPQLREVIAESIMAETHPDFLKGEDGKRSPQNGYNGNVLIHRCYGAVNIDGRDYRVKITLKEDGSHKGAPHKAYTYEVTKIELLGSTDGEGVPSTSYTSNSESIPTRLQTSDDAQAVQREVYLSTAKLLQNVEKSHDLGKKLLEQSEIADESTDFDNPLTLGHSSELDVSRPTADLYRDPDETEDISPDGATSASSQHSSRERGSAFDLHDIWNDQSLGLQERTTAAATRLANNHREDKTLRSDAMRAICDNLADLAKSMLGHPRKKDLTDGERRSVNAKAGDAARAQKRFDQTTVKRVSDLARVLISSGHLNGLSAGEVKRLLSAVKNSAGHDDIEGDVQKVMDIMVDNQLKQGESTLHELEAIRGSKVDARGVEVQGELDLAGQVMMEAFKDGRRLKREALEEEIGKALDRMSSESESVREDAENAYAGLQFALQYAARISDNEHAEKVLRDELKKKRDETSERDRMTDSYRQYVVSMEDAIRQKKIERAQAYHDLVAAMTGSLRESMANAKAFKESERKRVESIRHFANSDMQGMELRGQRPDSRLDRWNESLLMRLSLSPLHTFDQFMRLFGRKNADGKGYMYDHFVRKYIDSADHEQLMKEKYEGKLEAKVKELFGTHKVAGGLREVPYTYTSLYGYVDALPMTKVTYYDGAGKREYELSQAQLAYLYMVDKMPMGKATNRGMGVTEEVIEQIEGSLDAKLKEFADWVQEEFLVELGNECNEVHKRMFGANMDSIENYFPFVRDKNSINREVENGAGESMAERISTKTGAIIKRTPSVAPWDMPNANFLDVLAKHVSEMCQWSSYAELNRDLGTLQSFNRFKQQVLNMRTIYGSGEQLWKRFMQTCAIAGNAYEPKRGEADKLMVQGAKGVVMGKIAFRPMTAMKQLLSLPAFFGEVDMECLSRDFATGGIASVKWAWENMPNFRKRIKSRTAGDFRLSATKYDKEKGWTNTLMRISAYGMLPNIGVDAWTIALGSHAVYVKAKKKYLRQGYSEEKAERRAVQDAELCFNKSQQSSEGAFMAPVQIDHTFASTTMMLFRNSSTSYTRECVTSVRNLKRMMSGEVDVDFMAKQLLRNAEIPTFSMLFDAELQRQVEGTLPVGHIYSLGMPGGVLQSAGFPDAPIELSSTRLAEKASDPGHPFPIEALKGLVNALNDPVAVFNYGNNAMNVIVGLEYKGKHFLVGVHFNQQHRGTSVSDIRGLFPKDNAEWLNWISQGKARYLDHKRIKALIAQQRINLAEVDYLDLKDVAKVMESFVNPSIPEQKYFAGWRAEDVERAREQARKEYRSGYIRNSVNAVMFGFILPWLWRIGGLSILLTLGDDDDDKVSEVKKASKQSLFGPLEGIAYGDVIAEGLYVSANKLFGDGTEKFSNLGRTNPFVSDLADVLRKLDGDELAAVNDVLNMLVGMKTGVNLQTVSDWATAILDYSPDGDTSREVSLLVSRLLNAPQSQIEKIYFDEIGMSGDEALRLSPRELVERYAQYKVKREHFVTPWVWGDEALLDKKRKRGKTIVKERTEQMGDKEVNESYDRHAEAFKEMDVRVKDLKKSIKEAGSDVERQMLLEDIQHYMAGDTGSFYGLFKTYDKGLGDLAKMYLSAKTPDEATLCRQAVLDYKAAMVKVLDAPDEDARAEAIGDLGNVMREFAEKYAPMQQPNR